MYKNVQEVSPPNDLNLNNPNQFNLDQINLSQDSNPNQLNLNQNSPQAYEPGQVYYKPVEQVTTNNWQTNIIIYKYYIQVNYQFVEWLVHFDEITPTLTFNFNSSLVIIFQI